MSVYWEGKTFCGHSCSARRKPQIKMLSGNLPMVMICSVMLGGMCWSWRLLGCALSQRDPVSGNIKHTQMGDALKLSVFPWLKEVILHIVSPATQTPQGFWWQGGFPAFHLCLFCTSVCSSLSQLLSSPFPWDAPALKGHPSEHPCLSPSPAMSKALQLLPGCLGAFPGSAEQEKLFSLWQEPKQTQAFPNAEGKRRENSLVVPLLLHCVLWNCEHWSQLQGY